MSLEVKFFEHISSGAVEVHQLPRSNGCEVDSVVIGLSIQ
jgi:hypothetical protein